MDNNNILVSIIVPVYNVEKYINTCLHSIANQTFADYEVLLIDDGSTDNSGSICDDFCNLHNKFRAIHQDNMGLYGARNTGLKLAKGRYISFIDSDDYVHPSFLEILYSALLSGDYDFSMVDFEKVHDHHIVHSNVITHKFSTNVLSQNILIRNFYRSFSIEYHVVWNKLYKRETIESLYFKNIISEDTEFNNRVYLMSKKAIFVEACLYYYLQRNTSIIHKNGYNYNIDQLYSIYLCFTEIPSINSNYRAYCLLRLYKKLLSTKYYSKSTEFKYYGDKINRIILKNTFSSFVKNKNIFLGAKIVVLLFIYFPYTYKMFVWACDMRSKSCELFS
jgi:glycosyltransferase involved in cell wall biosynthesis